MSATMDVDIAALVRTALEEDVGTGDVTTLATVDADARAEALITQKAPGAIYGLDAAEAVFALLDPGARCERLVGEGVWRELGECANGGEDTVASTTRPEGAGSVARSVRPGGASTPALPVLRIEGTAQALLTGERTALNFLGHLSGVATMAARAARAVEGTGAQVLDTRKTTPGLRALEKAAVAAGGAHNHRVGLYDAILIKENHIAAAGGIAQAVELARAAAPELAATLEVEVRNPEEIEQALAVGAPRLLLDNMDVAQLSEAVALVAGRAQLEASGGVTLQTLRERAETGVEWISMGALTHSAPALDL
ncbi:MAG: carboxylating nicotinate-nucleotide diphosphorylase, partial [Solirubrobacteraceae bacterium]